MIPSLPSIHEVVFVRVARAFLPRLLTPGPSAAPHKTYFTSTVAPASVNFFLMVSASSFDTPSLTLFGAPSTRSLASFRPRLVTSRTALITLILFAPTSLRTTVNSVFSSAGAAPAAAPPPAPATTTGAAAAAETPRRSSSFFTSCAASRSDSPTIDSSNCSRSAMSVSPPFRYQLLIWLSVNQVSSAASLCPSPPDNGQNLSLANPASPEKETFSDGRSRHEPCKSPRLPREHRS